jgi:hypothetical protein
MDIENDITRDYLNLHMFKSRFFGYTLDVDENNESVIHIVSFNNEPHAPKQPNKPMNSTDFKPNNQ